MITTRKQALEEVAGWILESEATITSSLGITQQMYGELPSAKISTRLTPKCHPEVLGKLCSSLCSLPPTAALTRVFYHMRDSASPKVIFMEGTWSNVESSSTGVASMQGDFASLSVQLC